MNKKLLILLMFFSLPAYAEINYKEGIILYSMKNASKLNPYYELTNVRRRGNNAVELTAGYYDILISGEEYLYTDVYCHGIYGNNQVRAKLHSIPLSVGYTRYWKKLYAGWGAGYQILWLDRYYDAPEGIYNGEYYTGQERVNNTWFQQAKVGCKLTERMSVELKINHADVDMESGTYFIGLAEDRSNLTMIIFSVGWKW